MGKKKKQPINGYALFLHDLKAELEAKGRRFPNGLRDVSEIAEPLWREMLPERKQAYVSRAAEIKRKDANNPHNKFNSKGQSYAELQEALLDSEEYHNIMLSTIVNTVEDLDFSSTFRTYKFYLIHVNFFYKNDQGIYKPAEIALSEFNFKYGVLNTYHTFVDSGPIEKGFRYKAKSKADSTHRVPFEDPNWKLGERDYAKIYSDIYHFLMSGSSEGKLPPVYSMPDSDNTNTCLSAVKSTLSTLCEASGEDFNDFRVYELPILFNSLRMKAVTDSNFKRLDPKLMTEAMARHDIEKDLFFQSRNIACKYHEEIDRNYTCSLSIVTRWVYSMCDSILQFTPDNIIPGAHCPVDSETALKSAKVSSRGDEDDACEDFTRKLIPPKVNNEVDECFNIGNNSYTESQEPQPSTSMADSASFQLPSDMTFSHGAVDGGRNQAMPRPTYEERINYSMTAMQMNSPGSSEAKVESSKPLSTPPSINSSTPRNQSAEENVTLRSFIGRGRGQLRRSKEEDVNWLLSAGRGAKFNRK